MAINTVDMDAKKANQIIVVKRRIMVNARFGLSGTDHGGRPNVVDVVVIVAIVVIGLGIHVFTNGDGNCIPNWTVFLLSPI